MTEEQKTSQIMDRLSQQCSQSGLSVDKLNSIDADLHSLTQKMLDSVTSFGAYTESIGNWFFRESIARSIEARDGVSCNPADIRIQQGITVGIRYVFNTLIKANQTAILSPSPSYPLYEKYAKDAGGSVYNFDFDYDNIETTLTNMESGLKNAKTAGTPVKMLVLNNPNNPTGRVLTGEQIKRIIEFCYDNSILIIVDESFQDVMIDEQDSFISFRKILKTHENKDLTEQLELISFCSPSRGVFMEQNTRGCFFEMLNMDPEVNAMFNKFLSMMLCSNVLGQMTASLHFCLSRDLTLLNPETRELFVKEFDSNLSRIRKNSQTLKNKLDQVETLKGFVNQGGYYKWAKLSDTVAKRLTDQEYSNKLKFDTGLTAYPGKLFNKPGYLRFSVLNDVSELDFSPLNRY